MTTVACRLSMPDREHLYAHVEQNARHARTMVQQNSQLGRSVTICGAGPSLATHADHLPATRHVWACNSALPYLKDRGVRVTHGVTIDQGQAMLGPEEWGRTFGVTYLVASCVNPALVTHLLADSRPIRFFHSYIGIPDPEGWSPPEPGLSYEMWLYRTKYKPSVQVGYGLNCVPRAICLALYMGYADIRVYGADCACKPDAPPMPLYGSTEYAAWMDALVMYASGRTVGQAFGHEPPMAEAVIDGVRWHTRVDMIVSARHMLDLQRDYPNRITFHGEGLPTVFARQGPEFHEGLPALTGVGHVTGFGPAVVVA